jgi:nucleotide-binding universal stress UspA family protein
MGSPVFVGIQRILVAFDASPHAERALDVALSMAEDMKAKLFVLSVIRPPEPAESAEFHAVLDEGRERYERIFVPLRERCKQKDIEFETDTRSLSLYGKTRTPAAVHLCPLGKM